MASVRKRTWTYKGVEKTAWQVDYTDQFGKRHTVTEQTKRDADRRRFQIEKEVEQGNHTTSRNSVAVDFAVKEFLKELKAKSVLGDLAVNTVENIRKPLENHVVPWIGNLKLSDLTADMIEEKVREWRKAFAANTVVMYFQAIRALLKFAKRKKWLNRDILSEGEIKLPKKTRRVKVPTKSDILKLLQTVAERREGEAPYVWVARRLIVVAGVFCGLRPGETFGLMWEDFDFEKSRIHVQRTQSLFEGARKPKTEAGNRHVPLTEPVLDVLASVAWLKKAREYATAKGFRSYTYNAISMRMSQRFNSPMAVMDPQSLSGYVILDKNGRPYTTKTGSNIFNGAMKAAGLWDNKTKRPAFTMHALRHAAASLFIEAQLPAFTLKTVMGHASSRTTYDIYGHMFPEDTRLSETATQIAGRFYAPRAQQGALTN